MRKIDRFSRGMGIGGWLTNYKRFNVLPDEWRMPITIGDMEHFFSYITEDDVKNIAGMGLDHIRLGFDQIVLEVADEPYIYREEIFGLLKDFVGWCEKYDLRPVLNLHKAIGNYCDIVEGVSLLESPVLQERFIALWLKIEETFKDKPDVAFELLNEVLDVPPEPWNDLAAKTVAAIRKVNPDRLIIVGSTAWNSSSKLKDLKLFDDDSVIYTFHNYAPHCFTHQRGVLQPNSLYYNRAMAYPGDIGPYRDFYDLIGKGDDYSAWEKMDIDYLRQTMQGAFDFIEAHPDKILWCGEFGTIRHCKIEYRENWMRDMIRLLKEHDIPYCVWNYLSTPNDGNRFSLVDDDSRVILSEEMGRIIRGEV